MLELSVQDHLEVAHYMLGFPEGHPNRRLHGHSYVLIVTVASMEDVECVVDYDELKQGLRTVIDEYDHTCANDWLGTSAPTMENMCRFLWTKIKAKIPRISRITLQRPTLNMTVVYEGKLA